MSDNKNFAKDTALESVLMIADILGIPTDKQQLRRAYVTSSQHMDKLVMIRALQELGLKTRLHELPREKLGIAPCPSIAIMQDGRFVVILRTEDDGKKLVVLDSLEPKAFSIPVDAFAARWTGEIVMLVKQYKPETKESKFGLKWFIPVIWKYKKFFIQVLALSLILQAFGLLTPYFTQVLIDKVLVHRSLGTFNIILLAILAVNVFNLWMTALRGYLFSNTVNKVDVVLSTRLFRHVSSLSVKYFEKWQVGDVVSRMGELNTIRSFITGSAFSVVLDTIFACVSMAVLFMYSMVLSMVTVATIACFVVLSLVITPIYRELMRRQFNIATENQSFLIESITGVQTVKALSVEKHFIEKREQLLARLVKVSMSIINVGNVISNLTAMLQQTFTLLVLWFGAQLVMSGDISVGEVVAFQMISGQVLTPVLRLVNLWQSFQKTAVSIDRIGDIMNEKAEPAFNPNRTTLPSVEGNIIFERVSFRYDEETPEVLHQVDIEIKSGMTVGIVGQSGSGKSTITKLMQRLYVPVSGRVMIDGVDLAQVEPAWLRRQIGVVLQENFLFGGTIRDNIAIAKPDATSEEVERAAALAGATEFINAFSDGYDTLVGERGSALSGGQRQRIAIARALLVDPRILIFDEATSALDYETEKIIMDNLLEIAKGRTMVLIAHRLSTVRNCDLILFIERGRVLEQGTHEELMALKGHYYQQYSEQE